MTDGTGDAAIMLARLLPHGDGSAAASELGNLVRPLAATKEAHHFYPLLVYFRFNEPRYAVSRFTFVLLDLTTLIENLLDEHRYRSVINHVSIHALRHGARLLLETLESEVAHDIGRPRHAEQSWRLRQRYIGASTILADAHVAVQADRPDRYVAARREWEVTAERGANALGNTTSEIGAELPTNAKSEWS